MASSAKVNAYKQDNGTAELTGEEIKTLRVGKDVFAELGMKVNRSSKINRPQNTSHYPFGY